MRNTSSDMFVNVKTTLTLAVGLRGCGYLGEDRDRRKAERETKDDSPIMGSLEHRVKNIRSNLVTSRQTCI